MGFLTALLPLLAGITGPIKDYFSYKQDLNQKAQDYKLALLQSQIDTVKSDNVAETTQTQARLSATSQEFKQNTFWLLCVPVILSCIFPTKAAVMWHNFEIIPQWVQWLFLSVYSAIWGIPIAKGGYGAVTDLLSSRRDYKLEKARIDRVAVFNELKKDLFLKGMTAAQVSIIDKALDEGEK